MDDVSTIRESDVFSTLDRIDKKLKSLEKLLSPITNAIPKNTSEKVGGTTVLCGRLHNIEDSITFITDSVNL